MTTTTTVAAVAPRTEILVRVDRRRAAIIGAAPPSAAGPRADAEWVRVHDVLTARGDTYITTPYGVWVSDGRAEILVRDRQDRR